jgi:PPOX class probable F420-dependent enzyme
MVGLMTSDQIASCRYVLLVTRKRNGDTVSTPVWIAPLGGGVAGFTTEANAGKVKRIRNFPDVTLQPCDARGRVRPGSPVVPAVASIVTGAEFEPVHRAVKGKYGIQFRLIEVFGSVRNLVTRRSAADCGIVLRFGE